MVDYNPQAPPPMSGGDPSLLQLSQWAQRELLQLSQQLTNTDLNQYNVLYVAPDRPREGMTVVADGTHWNPGSGAGFYLYQGGAWLKLLDPASADALFLTQAEGDARYLLSGGAAPAAFSVHKNGTDQTGIPDSVLTDITWSTEIYDVGNHFASNIWTPPAGLVAMSAALSSVTAPTAGVDIAIAKNGSSFKSMLGSANSSGDGSAVISIEDKANGTDTYKVMCLVDVTAGTVTVSGNTTRTWFMGHWISP